MRGKDVSNIVTACGLEGVGLLESGGWGASKGETVGGVGPRFISFDPATTS